MSADVFLYSGEVNPSDIKLSDPTQLISAGGGTITGTSSATKSGITATVNALETFSATADASKSALVSSGSGAETFSATSAETKTALTSLATGAELFSASSTASKSALSGDATGLISNPITGTADATKSALQSDATGNNGDIVIPPEQIPGAIPFWIREKQDEELEEFILIAAAMVGARAA